MRDAGAEIVVHVAGDAGAFALEGALLLEAADAACMRRLTTAFTSWAIAMAPASTQASRNQSVCHQAARTVKEIVAFFGGVAPRGLMATTSKV